MMDIASELLFKREPARKEVHDMIFQIKVASPIDLRGIKSIRRWPVELPSENCGHGNEDENDKKCRE